MCIYCVLHVHFVKICIFFMFTYLQYYVFKFAAVIP